MTTYGEKLRDPRWQRLRLEVLSRADFRCEKCSDSTSTLNVHHRRYIKGREPWEYSASDLLSLCSTCHTSEHDARDQLQKMLVSVRPGACDMLDVVSLVAGYLHAIDAFATEAGREAADTIRENCSEDLFDAGTVAARSYSAVIANRLGIKKARA